MSVWRFFGARLFGFAHGRWKNWAFLCTLSNPTLVFGWSCRLLICFAVERIWSLRPSNKRVSLLYLDCVKTVASSTLAFLVVYAALAPLPYLLDDVAFYSAKANHLRYDTPKWLKSWIDFQFYHEVEWSRVHDCSNALSSINQPINQSVDRSSVKVNPSLGNISLW